MKLYSAVIHLGKSKMEVIAEDRRGHRRMVNIRWLTKEQTDVPPVFWVESVEGEHELALEHEYNEATGRMVPFK